MKMGKVFHYEGIGIVRQGEIPPRLGWYYQLDLDEPVGPYATKRGAQLAALALVRLDPVCGVQI